LGIDAHFAGAPREEDRRMRTTDPIEGVASDLLEAAQRFQWAAQEPGCHVVAPEALASLEEALQMLSAAWYQVAADAAPAAATAGLSRELEVQLVGTLHDIAAAFARCARMCRQGRSSVTPIIARPKERRATERVA
jgi:hypothetical protein